MAAEPGPARVIVLLGLPGAGKSTAGRLAAARLGWDFVDLDVAIETRAGTTVAGIFAREGEVGFRAREREETRRVARAHTTLVLAPGGGWVEDPSNIEAFKEPVCTVYLRCSVPVALERLAGSGEARPLVGGPDPAKKLADLLARRDPLYVQANHTISVDSLTPAQVATSIVAIASGSPGD